MFIIKNIDSYVSCKWQKKYIQYTLHHSWLQPWLGEAHLIRVDFISCFLQIASQGNYIFVAFQFSQFLRGECATKIENYSQFAWTGQELLKNDRKW